MKLIQICSYCCLSKEVKYSHLLNPVIILLGIYCYIRMYVFYLLFIGGNFIMGNILICYGFYTSDFRLMFFKKAIEIIPFNTSLENKSSSIA